ncbi:prolyl aminopeptidase [Candidatus Nucleicultrix amoebiphila]|jgi:proline iminopeptidase|uniref:Proline iminopeptidase n=1 Tax=Candidatus Nucleicultrix amoebiphila FS5 TaxID=1414854 RepID=A0A1W6N655_9PROT|nr:prolyl aminopeptidase [Candidatus Nucleicultrix amoebiphila]ARN85370.1 proline iminopeptidase [Candidatus Nucleicultrix amoebiphila FS5]
MSETMYELFPAIEPYDSGYLSVDELHQIYWEQCGNPQGVPIVFIHGGPGAGSSPGSRRFFDPKFYRIIVFDQRGAGRSRPFGEMRQNTTPLLVEDMEKLRDLLGIDQWILFGGSWGTTLGLAYAETYPQRCLGLILRGIFLCRPSEIEWFLYGTRTIYPEVWQRFADYIPKEERHDLLKAYHARVLHPDPLISIPACKEYFRFEMSMAYLTFSEESIAKIMEDEIAAIGLAKTEAHYFSHDTFLEENQLIKNAFNLKSIPGIIVHGRYDIVCPIISAYELHQVWPEAEFIIVPTGGHAGFDPAIMRELLKATEKFKTILR